MGMSKEISIPSGVKVAYWRIISFHTYWACGSVKPGDISMLPEAVRIAYNEIDNARKKDVTTDIVLYGYVTKEARDEGLPQIYETIVTIKHAPEATTGTDPRSILYLLSKTNDRFANAIDVLD